MWVPNFRKNALYQRSLDLFHEVYHTIEEDGEKLDKKEAMILRNRVLRITKKITQAIVQQNMKMKYKRLNESKNELENLLDQIYQLCNIKMIDEWNGFIIDYYADHVMKLLNYYFGKYKEEKS